MSDTRKERFQRPYAEMPGGVRIPVRVTQLLPRRDISNRRDCTYIRQRLPRIVEVVAVSLLSLFAHSR